MNLVKDTVADLKGIPKEIDLVDWLRKEVLEVTFNKLDGDERIMTCTKMDKFIPEDKRPKTDKAPKEGTVTVWDIKADGWRSFRYDRVTKVESRGIDFSQLSWIERWFAEPEAAGSNPAEKANNDMNMSKKKLKDFSGNLIRVNILEQEIEHAKSQLQPHDTGHIYTAISWLEQRVRELKGIKEEDELDYPDGYSNEWRRQQKNPRHNQSSFKGKI